MNQLYQFPLALYQKTIQKRKLERTKAIEEKNTWLKVRNALSIESQSKLDNQFLSTFIKLGAISLSTTSFEKMEPIYNELIHLVSKGSSAKLLDQNELGSYNLAQLAKDIVFFDCTNQQFELIVETFRCSILTDAVVLKQKAYVGNGGAEIFYFLSNYFLLGLNPYDRNRKNVIHYSIYFKLFSNLIAFYPEAVTQYDTLLYDIAALPEENLFCTQDLQFEFYFSIIHYLLSLHQDDYFRKLNFYYFYLGGTIEEHQHSIIEKGYFGKLIDNLIKNNLLSSWLPILLPFNNKSISTYIDYQIYAMLKEKLIIDYFKKSKQSRVFFKVYFSQDKHWFLDNIIKNSPEYIFSLVKHAEIDLLMPFCKNYPEVIRLLKNANNQSLLDFALLQKRTSEKIIEKFKSMHVPIFQP